MIPLHGPAKSLGQVREDVLPCAAEFGSSVNNITSIFFLSASPLTAKAL